MLKKLPGSNLLTSNLFDYIVFFPLNSVDHLGIRINICHLQVFFFGGIELVWLNFNARKEAEKLLLVSFS